MVDPDDVLALLEDGPKPSLLLAEWLRVPEVVALNVLTEMRQARLVKRIDFERWALHTDPTAEYRELPIAAAEYEVVWRPHRDSASLTSGEGGLGQSLCGRDFKVNL